MANKKLQNNQNKKNTEGPTMNGINSAASIQNASQILQGTNSGSSNTAQNNNNSQSNFSATASTVPNSSLANSPNSSYVQQNQPQSLQSHQRHSSTSSSTTQQMNSSKQPARKSQNIDVEKIYLQINTSAGSQLNQGGFRGSGNKDQRTKEKEKEKNTQGGQNKQGNQQNHHQQPNHNNGGGNGGNQQNTRKKDNKFQNRDLSNQSHRGGYSNYGNHHQQYHTTNVLDNAKSSGFPSSTSINSLAGSSVSPTPVVPMTLPVFHESKTVQTEAKAKKEKPKPAKKEEESSPLKSSDPKYMDTVLAFKEHDEWNKVEFMCELLYLLSPMDLRLVMNCIEGAVRCYTNQMRPVEKTSNCAEPTACLPQYICVASQPQAYPNGNDPTSAQQRALVNGFFSQQHPPGLPPLIGSIPNIVHPMDPNYSHPSSSTTPSSSVSTSTKDNLNGVTAANNTTGGNNISPETQQQDFSKNSVKGNVGLSSSTTPEPEPSSNVTTNRSPISTQQSEPPVPQEPEKFFRSVRDLTSYVYTLMSVCASTNRKSAAKISDYTKDVILREKDEILKRLSNELDKIDVLQDIGKIISAMTHHPAVSLDDKIKYADMRDGLRAEIESLFREYYSPEKEAERRRHAAASTEGVGDEDYDEYSDDEHEEDLYDLNRHLGINASHSGSFFNPNKQSTVHGTFFITRFIGRQVEKNDNLFSLEIHWSDGDRTFAQRTNDQLKVLQHRLLDEFGQQRSEKYNHHHGTASSMSSFDEDNKKLSTSTSTMETSLAQPGERIVPRLARDATPAQYVQYINELSDLPARMMLSSVICEEFNGTRSRTEDENRDSSDGLIFSRWKNPRAKSPVRYFQRNTAGGIEQVDLPVNLQPFLYSNGHQSQLQMLYPSCSNCGGSHFPKNCDKPTLLDKKALVEHKLRIDQDGSITTPNSQLGGSSSVNSFPPMHAPMTHPIFIDASQGMLGPAHYNHHHPQQQMLHNSIYNGRFRPNGQFDPHVPLLYYANQQVVQTANNSAGNGGNGGGVNQNNNF